MVQVLRIPDYTTMLIKKEISLSICLSIFWLSVQFANCALFPGHHLNKLRDADERVGQISAGYGFKGETQASSDQFCCRCSSPQLNSAVVLNLYSKIGIASAMVIVLKDTITVPVFSITAKDLNFQNLQFTPINSLFYQKTSLLVYH